MRNLQRIRRLLLVRNDGIGDLVLTLPTIAACRKCFPDAWIAALVLPANAELLRDQWGLDEVIVDEPGSSAWLLSQRLAAYGFDAALLFNSANRNALATWMARIPLRVAWGGRVGGLLLGSRHVFVRRNHPPMHESEFAAQFLRRLVPWAECPPLSISHRPPECAGRMIRARLAEDFSGTKPLFAVHPGNNGSAYNWPVERYGELVARLASGGAVVLTGGPSEQHVLERIRSSLSWKLRDRVAVYNDLTLTQLLGLLAEVDCLTVSSTGPMHLAALVDTPTVALFSAHPAHSPRKWAPLGRRVTILQAPLLPGEHPHIPPSLARSHMERISVRAVVQANWELVNRSVKESASSSTRGDVSA